MSRMPLSVDLQRNFVGTATYYIARYDVLSGRLRMIIAAAIPSRYGQSQGIQSTFRSSEPYRVAGIFRRCGLQV